MKALDTKVMSSWTEIRAQKAKQRELEKLVEHFRNATNPKHVKRLGDKLGRMIFGD